MNIPKTLWNLYRLKQNERRTPSQLRALQQKKLRRLLYYAWDHSAYYREAFAAAGITRAALEDTPLEQFPTLDKATLFRQFDRLITVPELRQEELRRFDAEEAPDRKPFLGKYHVVHSSGSTGTPGYFVYDRAAWETMLSGILRGALWGMPAAQILRLLAGKPRILYIAATDGRYGGAMAVGDGIDGVGARSLYLDIKTPLSQWVDQVKAFRPNFIIGYPSAMKILAELAQQGEVSLEIFRMVSCGEPLGAGLRGFLEETFHTQVVNFYGASESLALGVESDPEEGMLLFDDLNILEAGEDGLYLTCLYNFAQPLIRYRLSDRIVIRPPEEGIRFPFFRAVGLLGRSEDVLWFKDAFGNREFLHPLAVEGFCVPGLLDYQFSQIGPDSFQMLAEVSGEASQEYVRREMGEQMGRILAEKGMEYVDFSLHFVPEILPDPRTGKKRLVGKTMENFGRCAE
ncbi:MAG: phenylacetate--CoA ligase family protein [Provencibacterium sp.]|jgi:phenylacetate-CoA ligase|nr:phenylacetate--CoA ligase family protein [Provencibacterium sp.]